MEQNTVSQTGYAPVNGLDLYYEIHGQGYPLILLHGGLGINSMFGEVLPLLAQSNQVIAVELQGHGHTADIDRPLRLELMGDDIAALVHHGSVRYGWCRAQQVAFLPSGGSYRKTLFLYS
jgi:pimeloyl-ACP methyl ester carboxylesterase